MQLVPRYADESGAGAGTTDQGPALAVPTAARQALGLRLATVTKRALGNEVIAVGSVSLNERDISIVQARSGGFVEKVYARAPGDVIAAGAPLVDLLTPEWLAAQQEFLAVRSTGDAALTQAARQRMLLLGMPAALIDKVESSGTAQAVQTLTAPSGGVIAELMVRAGMTVGAGMTLARINGLGTVWLEAAVPEAQAATVKPGQQVEATFPALPGEKVKGRVAAILPEANRDTRTLRVRIELPNPGGRLKAGLFAQVALRGAARDGQLVVPAEAVIRTGRRALVYIAEPQGRFRPVEVEVGEQVDEFITVRSGLAEGQQVVASGQFLLDSEASLQGVMARSQPVGSTLPAALGGAAVVGAAASTGAAPPPAAAPDYGTQGVVLEIEADSITLDHQPVPALKWPGMEMPFKLADKKLVKGLKPGQTVDFRFVQKGDDWMITRITPRTTPAPAPAAKPAASPKPTAPPADPHAGHAGHVMPGTSK
jgi:Cu(I)/Ag(I) efflux system membrane fusion protein